MHPSCAQETLLYVRNTHVRRSMNSVQIQQDQRLLVIRNAFLVKILGFHVIGIGCRDKQLLCSGPSMCPSPSKGLDRLVDVDREVSDDVYGVTGVVLDFQTLQIQQLAVVNDPSSRFKNSPPKLLSRSSSHKPKKSPLN